MPYSGCVLTAWLNENCFSWFRQKRNFADQSQQRKIRYLTNQSLRQTCSPSKAHEKKRVSRAIPIGFAFNWLKKSIEIFWSIKKRCNQLELEAKSSMR